MILSNIDGLKPFSHKKITIKCDYNLSDKCLITWECKLSEIATKRKRNNLNTDYCYYCNFTINQSGEKSHFNKYYKNDSYFSNIDSEDKAYFLGWIASDGHVRRNRFTIKILAKDSSILDQLSKYIKSNIPVRFKSYENKTYAILDVSSMKMSADLIKLLNIEYGPKDFTVSMPKLNDKLSWVFIRGLFEGDGYVPKISSNNCRIVISSVSKSMKNSLKLFLNKFDIISCIYDRNISINGINASKVINFIYNNCDDKLCLLRKMEPCLFWRDYSPKTKKLDLDKARKIRELKKNGMSIKELMTMFNVGKNTIYYIINNISYKEKE
jgi:DNA-binding transcriptional regulator WhiA